MDFDKNIPWLYSTSLVKFQQNLKINPRYDKNCVD